MTVTLPGPHSLLRPDQVEDLCLILDHKKFGLLHDPGGGKTPTVCVALWMIWEDFEQRSAFVMPKSLLHKNREEILRFTKFKSDEVVIVDGPPKKRYEVMRSDAKVFLMGFTCFSNEWEILVKAHPDVKSVAVDEIHLGYGHDS